MSRVNEKSYSVTIICNSEVTSLSALVYSLQSKVNVFFADLTFKATNADESKIKMPSNRQTTTKEELFKNNNSTVEINEDRENDVEQLTKKLKEIFGNNCMINITNKN